MTENIERGPAKVGVVLAGGASRRMGRPKAMVELANRPLISLPLAAVEAAGLEAIVVAKPSSKLPALGCRLVEEPERPRHPLLGVVTALRAARGPVVVIACDMPFVTGSLLGHLASIDAPLAICEAAGRLHPLLGRYDPSLAGPLEAACERGESVTQAVRALRPRIVGEDELRRFGSPAHLCANLNTDEDVRAAEGLAAEPHP